MTRILIIGGGSFLARAVLAQDPSITAVGHGQMLSASELEGFDVVVNCALDPRFMKDAYDEGYDADLRAALAVRAARRPHLVMLSTRRVYGPNAPFGADEATLPAPADRYGENKLRSEARVADLLGERCTVLRVANVFGFEPGRHTFFGIALRTLRDEGLIRLDVSEKVRRDFLPLEDFARALRKVCDVRPAGLFNLGSGAPTALGSIANALIEGYGAGRLVVDSDEVRDEFLLDSSKLNSRIGYMDRSIDVAEHCIRIGDQLKNA